MTIDLGSIEEIISRLGRSPESYFPDRMVDDIRLEKTIPRPYSQLARIRIGFSDGVERAYIKIYRHPRLGSGHNRSSAEREHDAHATLFEAFRGVDSCSVVRPIASFPDLGGWVMEAVEGPTLAEELHRKGHRLASPKASKTLLRAVAEAGTWLDHLHRQIRRDESVSVEECGVLEDITTLLEQSTALDDLERQQMAAYAQNLVRQLGTDRLDVVGQHGECYAPHHIFVTNGRLLVFDITGIKYGPLFEDLSNLWVGLEALRKYPLFSEPDVQRLQRAFLEGYGSDIDPQNPALALYELKNMLKLSSSWSRGAAKDWRGWARRSNGRWFIRRWLAGRAEGP